MGYRTPRRGIKGRICRKGRGHRGRKGGCCCNSSKGNRNARNGDGAGCWRASKGYGLPLSAIRTSESSCSGWVDKNIALKVNRGGLVNGNLTYALTGRAIKHLKAVPLGHLGNTNNLLFQLLKLKVEVATVFVAVGVVNGLNGKLTHALHHVGEFARCPFGSLNKRDGIARIAHGLVQGPNLRCHAG